MKTNLSRNKKKTRKAFHVATVGRAKVPVYKRRAPNGSRCFMVVNYATGKRRFDSYADEAEAMEAALKLARQMSERQVVAAAMTNEQASEYAASVQKLEPFNVTLLSAADAVAEGLKLVGDLANFGAALKFYAVHNKRIVPKRVEEVVAEFIAAKEKKRKSERYLGDLRARLNRFSESFKVDVSTVTTADVQHWLDRLDGSPQTAKNFRTVINTLFNFAESRGYAIKNGNPVADTETISANGGEIQIYTPSEIKALLESAPCDFLPLVALGAFAGLRTAEAERIEWQAIDLAGGFIHIGERTAKTKSRRLVPILPSLAQWLAPYAKRTGKVWQGTLVQLREARAETVAKSGVAWKQNALRHSFVSYRLADIQNAAQVALEAGNSPQMVFKFYREIVKPDAAKAWFGVTPDSPVNVIQMVQGKAANE